jgi:hypothetical protein
MKDRRLRTARPCLEELEGRLVPSVATTSTNWSGYAVNTAAGAVKAVSGSWVIPTVSGTSTAYSSDWVGIDGFSSSTVEQIGTDSDIVNGTPQYYAWYEMYPNVSVNIPMTIRAGDTVSASVAYGSAGFTLSLTDVTTGKSYTTTQTISGALRSSAEWVVEAPSSNFGILPLANFGKVTLTGAAATIGSSTGAIDNPAWSGNVYQINMVSPRSGAAEDTTSALTDSGIPATSSFTVTYDAAATTPPRPRGRGWWREAEQAASATPTTPPTSTTASAASATAALGALLIATPRPPSAPLPATVQQATVAALAGAAAVATPAAPLRQGAAAVAGHASDVGDPTSGSADQPAVPEALPAPNESGAPSAQPFSPEAAPASEARDACFIERRWEPAAPPEGAGAPVGGAVEAATDVGAAGLVLALTLGGPWTIAREHAGGRRRRLRLPSAARAR